MKLSNKATLSLRSLTKMGLSTLLLDSPILLLNSATCTQSP